MTRRSDRARFLGQQLASVMDALAMETHGVDVVFFLDRLARLEAYPVEELVDIAGLHALISEAANARAEHADVLAQVAGAVFDLEELLHVGRHLPAATDGDGAHDAWLRDVLLVATVAPWLTPARRRQVQWMVEAAVATVEADPEGFLAASGLASDRHDLESPAGLGEEARTLLQALLDLPLLVAVDRAPARRAKAGRVDAILRAIDPALLDAVEDALADHGDRAEIGLPGPTERLSLAAADATSAVLVRMEAGAWVISTRGTDVRLRFDGPTEEVSVDVEAGAAPGLLPREPDASFRLPPSSSPLGLRLRVGPDSRFVQLKPAGSAT